MRDKWILNFPPLFFCFVKKELIYHSVAAILILIASIVLIVVINDNRYWHDVYKPLMAATVSQRRPTSDDFARIWLIVFNYFSFRTDNRHHQWHSIYSQCVLGTKVVQRNLNTCMRNTFATQRKNTCECRPHSTLLVLLLPNVLIEALHTDSNAEFTIKQKDVSDA